MVNKRYGFLAAGIILALAAGILTGCGSTAGEPQGEAEDGTVVPDWILADLRERFSEQARELVTKEKITLVALHMTTPEETEGDPELAAYVSLDRLNGVFVLYAKRDGQYQEVYARNEPVYGVQVSGSGRDVAVVTGYGGTGTQHNTMYVIRHTPSGYKEVWSGIAHTHETQYTTIEAVDGSVQFDLAEDKLIYSQLVRTLDISGNVQAEKGTYQIYRYDEATEQYVPM